jgi:5-methyltetrahydropteroyltriglutamate--homocysteine methyltransferase
VNQKDEQVASAEAIATRARRAVHVFGADRVLLTPDCGFATFADNPIAPAARAEATMRAIAEAAALVRRG